jgi:hypothetical protein
MGSLIGLFCVSIVCHGILIGLISKCWWFETRRFVTKRPCAIPRSLFTLTWSIMFCSLCCILSTGLYVARARIAASIINGISSNLYCVTFVAVLYQYYIMLLKSQKLGNLERKWRIISRITAICGGIGLFVALIVGILLNFAPDDPFLNILVTAGLFVGMLVPICCALPVLIKTIPWLRKLGYKDRITLRILWNGNWIMLGTVTFVLLCLISVFTMAYYFYSQLFTVIILRNWVIYCQFILGQSLNVAFVLNSRRPRQSMVSAERAESSTPSTPPNTSAAKAGETNST